jgi:CheY-like chemotaxis protein
MLVPADGEGRGDRYAGARGVRVTRDSSALGANILVVDGHADTAEGLQILLASLGHSVHVAFDAATAVALASERAFDLGFLAINLPDMDGYTLARRLRSGGSPRALVALTGHGFAKDRERAIDAGFDVHLLKPATVEQLEAVVARFVAKP